MSNSAVNLTIDEASTNLSILVFNENDILECNILAFTFLCALLSNTYVIWLIVTGAGNRAASEFIILNLSVCGLFFSLYCLIDFSTKFFVFPSLLSSDKFLLGVCITGLPLFQCLMCVERYVAVVHPVTFLMYKPLRYKVICCSVAWILTIASCIICMLVFTLYTYMWFLLIEFLLFLSIKLFCCLAVLRALKRSGPGGERAEENHMKRRAFYLILMTTVNTVIAYVPLSITLFIFIVTQYFLQIIWSVSVVFFMLGGFLPTVLYLQRTVKFSCASICNIST